MQLIEHIPKKHRPTVFVASLCGLFWLLFFVPWLTDTLTTAGREGGISFWFLELFRVFLYGSFGFLVGNFAISHQRRAHAKGKTHEKKGDRKLPSLHVATTETAAPATTNQTQVATRGVSPPPADRPVERDEDDEEDIALDPSLREMDEWLTSFARKLLAEESGSSDGSHDGGNVEKEKGEQKVSEGDYDSEIARALQTADECLATKPRRWQLAKTTLQGVIDRDKKSAPPELYWRLARCCYVQAKETPGLSDDKRKDIVLEGFSYAEEALKKDGNIADVHKWFAIMAGEVAIFSAPAIKIKNGHLVKKHTEEALALSPQDPDLLHMLGRFFYECAEIPWLKKKAAAAAFGPLPEGTFEDAAHRFEQAMRIKPQWVMNEFWLAQTYVKMGKSQQAMKVIASVLALPLSSRPTHSAEDEHWFAEAEKLHQKL